MQSLHDAQSAVRNELSLDSRVLCKLYHPASDGEGYPSDLFRRFALCLYALWASHILPAMHEEPVPRKARPDLGASRHTGREYHESTLILRKIARFNLPHCLIKAFPAGLWPRFLLPPSWNTASVPWVSTSSKYQWALLLPHCVLALHSDSWRSPGLSWLLYNRSIQIPLYW